MGLEAVARLCYQEAMQRALATLPLAKMYDVGEGAATAVAVERSATGLKERYEGVVRAIGEAQFTGKGDKEKVCGAAAGGVSAVLRQRVVWGRRFWGGVALGPMRVGVRHEGRVAEGGRW